MPVGRRQDLDQVHALLHQLQRNPGGPRYLRDDESKRGLPERGVYFFLEPGELRKATNRPEWSESSRTQSPTGRSQRHRPPHGHRPAITNLSGPFGQTGPR